jgi:AcrR family transcriptional regulator
VSDHTAKGERAANPRARLTRDRVLAAAMTLADEGGIESLTMRRLARALGVETMTTYYHAANKDDILAGITDRVVGEMEPPSRGGDWKAAIRASAISTHEVLRRHPWAADLLMSSTRVSPARLRQMERLLACLREAGFADELTDHAYHAIDIYVLGFALWEARFRRTIPGPLADLATTVLGDPTLADYPHVADHVAFHLRVPSGTRVGTYEFGLDLILDGLEQALATTG